MTWNPHDPSKPGGYVDWKLHGEKYGNWGSWGGSTYMPDKPLFGSAKSSSPSSNWGNSSNSGNWSSPSSSSGSQALSDAFDAVELGIKPFFKYLGILIVGSCFGGASYALFLHDAQQINWLSASLAAIGAGFAIWGGWGVFVNLMVVVVFAACVALFVGGGLYVITQAAEHSAVMPAAQTSSSIETTQPQTADNVQVERRTATVSGAENIWLRSGPGTNFDTIRMLPSGTKVSVVGSTPDGWREVQVSDGNGQHLHGFASAKYLPIDQQ